MLKTTTFHKPTLAAMCGGCVRELLSEQHLPQAGNITYKVCKAYPTPGQTLWARHGKPCPLFSDGKESC